MNDLQKLGFFYQRRDLMQDNSNTPDEAMFFPR